MQHPDGASAENEDKVVRKMVLKHAAPRSTVAAAPSGRTRGASGPPPPGSHRCLQLIGVTLFCTLSKAVSVYRIGPYLHVLARRVESGCRVSGESMSVRLRVSAQLDTILVGL